MWSNNDLWKLLPAAREVDFHKDDSLPTRALLIDRADVIHGCWPYSSTGLAASTCRFTAPLPGSMTPVGASSRPVVSPRWQRRAATPWQVVGPRVAMSLFGEEAYLSGVERRSGICGGESRCE